MVIWNHFNQAWKVFISWIQGVHFSSHTPNIAYLEFLQQGLNKNLAVSTMKMQVAALSVFLDIRLEEDPLFKRFIKAVARSKPSRL